ncbi:hypothetical protein [Cysteiniphilum sp. 6C5]|uniref:hypothetical protein n=1 Tax=unclassified Cysteiniphilum TaxID=2610889 RepID=UPI003F867725
MLKSLTEYINQKRNSPLKHLSKKETQNIIDTDMPESVKVEILKRAAQSDNDSIVHKRKK